MAYPHFSHVVDPNVRGNSVIHFVADQQMKKMKAANSSES